MQNRNLKNYAKPQVLHLMQKCFYRLKYLQTMAIN